jgi:glutamate transport system permease protein
MSSVLFDEPGPRTRARYRIYTAVFAVVMVLVLWWVYVRLKDAGELDPEVFEALSQPNIWTAIRSGLRETLKAAALGISFAIVLGVLLAVARLSEHRWVRLPAQVFIEFFRAVPLLLLILMLRQLFALRSGLDTYTTGLVSLVVGLTIYNGCVLAEVFRAGIQAVPKGQSEAAYAVGMRKNQVMRLVLMPQAVRFMLPAIISQCVVVLKDTSLGSFVVYPELLRELRGIAEFVNNNLMTYLLGAAIYIVLNSILSLTATWLEKRQRRQGRAGAQVIEETGSALPMT